MAATQAGLFTPLGQGDVDIAGVVETLEAAGYRGWYVIEQDTAITGRRCRPTGEGPVDQVRPPCDYLTDVVAPAAWPASPTMGVPEIVTVGRVSVDLYAAEAGAGFDEQQSFTKSVGGSPTNVAVAAARLGRRTALGDQGGRRRFRRGTCAPAGGLGRHTDYVVTQPGGQTPLALAALTPPETPQIAFYRGPRRPTPRWSRPTCRTTWCAPAGCSGSAREPSPRGRRRRPA